MKSVMSHSFAKVPTANISRSAFDRSHGHKTTIDADYIYPVYVDEALPGDTINMRGNFFARMATPIHPVMDNLFIDSFFFAIPMRILWTNWEKFLGAQDDPGDSIDFTIPTKAAPATVGYLQETLADYMGLPPDIPDFTHSAMFFRAYAECWNEWFRDENLQNSITVSKADGPDTTTSVALQKRGKRHDYFTSCLPWPQKQDTAVTLPLGTSAPVTGIGFGPTSMTTAAATNMRETDGTGTGRSMTGWEISSHQETPSGQETWMSVEQDASNTGFPDIRADLTNATAATINAIRLAVTTQQFLERDARGGTRINELILSHFNVMTLDSRVQRPEYLGGGSTPIGINTVPQTSETNTTPQGTLSGFGTAFGQNQGFTKSFTEHCVILGLVSVRADLTYQQGLHKMWSRSTRYDFFWPEFQNIGEQAVLQQEIELTDPAGATNDDVWGYNERYAEYRFMPSRISGIFRSSATGTLDPWHLSEDLSTPALDSTFIPSNTPMARVEAIPAQPDFLLDCYFKLNHVRPMSTHAVPGLARF